MRVWRFNGVITTYEKRDCRNSWRYTSLAVNRGAIKRCFTVHVTCSRQDMAETFLIWHQTTITHSLEPCCVEIK